MLRSRGLRYGIFKNMLEREVASRQPSSRAQTEGSPVASNREEKRKKKREKFRLKSLVLPLVVFLMAAGARVIYLFLFTDFQSVAMDWYGDVYHHWQIAYLSKEIGFKKGFLRLWDLKGMEYYWGLLHPLILILGFAVSGSYSILVAKIISIFFGSLAVCLIYLICSRYFNKKTGFFAALFVSFMPVAVFADTLGMQAQIGLFCLLLGVYFWQTSPFLTGIFWMLAGMVRAEYWLFGAGLTLAAVLRGKNFDKRIQVLAGYGIVLLFYAKYMLDHTGNAIYPIYYNFVATVAGEWFDKTISVPDKVWLIKSVCQGLAIFFFVMGLLVLWRRFKGWLLFLTGLSNLTFIFFVFGFGYYLYGYPDDPFFHIIDKLWVDRLMAWPYSFLGVVLAVLLFYSLPKLGKRIGQIGLIGQIGQTGINLLALVVFAAVLAVTQLIWPSINYHYTKAMVPLEDKKEAALLTAENYQNKGTIFVPEGMPDFTYFLVAKGKIPGKVLVSQMYDPFFYYEGEGDPYNKWGDFREKIIEWLEKHNAELFIVPTGVNRYRKMLQFEEGKLFERVAGSKGMEVWRVSL